MSSGHASLDAAATDRKARLAKLASLKRKQPGSDVTARTEPEETQADPEDSASATDTYLSGRNYDVKTKNAKLGFENAPIAAGETLEAQAKRISLSVAEQAAKDEAEAEKGIDLFKLQPKKPNWDLKRDLAEKMKILDVRTQNALARLVRERIENAKKEASKSGNALQSVENDGPDNDVGLEGSTLVEGVRLREREEEREAALENEEDDIS